MDSTPTLIAPAPQTAAAGERDTVVKQADLDAISKEMLGVIADMHGETPGAVNIRANGCLAARTNSDNIRIESKKDKPGIDIIVAPHTKGEQVHIPVVLTETGENDVVYNDFYIGEGADVYIVAGCGIHNDGDCASEHDGIHTFYLEPNSHVVYVEKHYGEGEGTGERILNPTTEVHMKEGSSIEMEMDQIEGVSSTVRTTRGELADDCRLLVVEKLMTHGHQTAESDLDFVMNGDNSSVRVVSRSVAKDESSQLFQPVVTGKASCRGHVQCDAIIMDHAQVKSVPAIDARSTEAQLVHEAAIGKIAGDAIVKLETLGLTEAQAEEQILEDFLS
jgi:Fe-S cluster assembly scaffold protein SufB